METNKLMIEHIALALFSHGSKRDSGQDYDYESLWRLLPEGARERWRGNALASIEAMQSYKHSVPYEAKQALLQADAESFTAKQTKTSDNHDIDIDDGA